MIKFRGDVHPTAKRAAVRSAMQVSASSAAGDEEAAARVDTLRRQLESLDLEGGSWAAVLHPLRSISWAQRCTLQIDAHGRLAAWPRQKRPSEAEAAGRKPGSRALVYCFVDELEAIEVTNGEQSVAEKYAAAEGLCEADDGHMSGWVWREEAQAKRLGSKGATFTKIWADIDKRAARLTWWHAPPDRCLPRGLGRLLESVTASAATAVHAEEVTAVCELAADTSGGHAAATSEWLTQRLAFAIAEANVSMLLKTMTVANVMLRSGSADLAAAISVNCRPVVVAAADFDGRTSEHADTKSGEVRAVSQQLISVMNAAPPPEQDSTPAPIAHADLTGCNSSPPKNSRQKDGFEHTLRLDLANKDSVGASKYIFGFRSMSALEEWTVAIQHTTGATRVRRMSRAGAMLAKGRELSSAASSKVGLDMPLPAESMCGMTLHFAKAARQMEPTVDISAMMSGGAGADAVAGGAAAPSEGRRRAALGSEPLRLGFATSAECEEVQHVLSAQLARYRTARARILPQLRVVTQRLRQPFDPSSQWHMDQLMALWDKVFDGRPYQQGTSEFSTTKAWVSDGWKDMGFQNADPSTDLRAMGMLGIHCLLRFTELHTDYVRALCKVTASRPGSYPFALTGINLGKLMVDLMLLSQVNLADITDADDPGPSCVRCWQTPLVVLLCTLDGATDDVFEAVFARLVQFFERAWLMSGCSSVMDFQRVFNDVDTSLRKHLERRGTLEELDEIEIGGG